MQPAESISARAARQPNTAAPVTEKLVFGPVLLASHGLKEGGTAPLCSSTPARWGWRVLSRSAWDRAIRSGRSPDWLKFKNPEAPAVKREAEEDWGH